MHPLLRLSDEVEQALREGRPVVALETTVINHGPPYPGNLELALATGRAVREGGAIPATIGIADGHFVVGMSESELERFADTKHIPKASTRDIGLILASGGLGATTVASSLLIADNAGIPVLSTGGIGGVHRNASVTFDISPDLVELTRHQVAMVCSGAKSILDVGLTLEYLETLGVPVIGYRCADFPAYYCTSSGFPNPQRADDLTTLAAAIDAHWEAGAAGSVVVTSPIEAEDALDSDRIEQAVRGAVQQAEANGVHGAAITPYLLKVVSAATEGRSAAASRSVLISTAKLAGQVACAFADRQTAERSTDRARGTGRQAGRAGNVWKRVR
ncbi:pseudouridine-5'-phosphate glycosidase [Streptomyces coffeae]|uniref:Pseudouridine-5'-phosphate glycosidase n=1 Tax=Streptomyces coffeae TaxID=621382 RepID=A0ABS1NLR9_9ACTN|nr:pseudouridine-5'-phosphate glycosidase [Streptomyces coffeae]MBL1101045.1 pseudouridine-5'-phosphate glycosidase [Streptomyces coffeae]